MQLKLLISFLLISWLSINTNAQEQKPFWLGVHANRSFATSGDYFGVMPGVFLEKPIKKNRTLGMAFDFNMHRQVDAAIFASPTGRPEDAIDMSYRTVMSGIQLYLYGGKRFKLAGKHFLSTDIGPIVRVQFNSNDRFATIYPGVSNLPFPVISFDNRFGVKATTFSAGVKAVLQYQYQLSENWRVGLHGSIQSDTQGDNFYNYGLTAATRFLR